MTEGMLFVGQPPTLRRFRAALERGIEELLEAALRKDLSKRVPFWEERLEALVLQQSREIRVPMGAGGGTELAAMATLWERTAGLPRIEILPGDARSGRRRAPLRLSPQQGALCEDHRVASPGTFHADGRRIGRKSLAGI